MIVVQRRRVESTENTPVVKMGTETNQFGHFVAFYLLKSIFYEIHGKKWLEEMKVVLRALMSFLSCIASFEAGRDSVLFRYLVLLLGVGHKLIQPNFLGTIEIS